MKDFRDKYRRINIPITEEDIRMFESLIWNPCKRATWTFETNDGEPINITFKGAEEEDE